MLSNSFWIRQQKIPFLRHSQLNHLSHSVLNLTISVRSFRLRIQLAEHFISITIEVFLTLDFIGCDFEVLAKEILEDISRSHIVVEESCCFATFSLFFWILKFLHHPGHIINLAFNMLHPDHFQLFLPLLNTIPLLSLPFLLTLQLRLNLLLLLIKLSHFHLLLRLESGNFPYFLIQISLHLFNLHFVFFL